MMELTQAQIERKITKAKLVLGWEMLWSALCWPLILGMGVAALILLLVEVKSSAIHDARTPLEVLRHLSAIIPFIELPDLVVEDPSKIGGVAINLINVGARLGVLGAPLPVQADEATVAALRDMTVRLLDGDGKELDVGKGSAILDQPLNAVIWLANDLKQSGITLRAGDLLSLGSFSKLLPPKPGTGAKVVYEGLPGNPSVSVRFE